MGSLWSSAAPTQLKRVVFTSRVFNAAISGMTSFVFTSAACKALDVPLFKYMRIVGEKGPRKIKRHVCTFDSNIHESIAC